MLEALMRQPGDVLSRFDLLEQVWGYDYENRSNVVEVYVRYVREKIDRPFGRNSLQTVRGVGYRLCGRGIAPDYQPADLQRWLRRLPIRWRLTLMFAAVMAVLLAGADRVPVLPLPLGPGLQHQPGPARPRAGHRQPGPSTRTPPTPAARSVSCPTTANNVVQVLDEHGRVLGASAGAFEPAAAAPAGDPRGERRRQLIQRGNGLRLYAMPLPNDHNGSSSPACRWPSATRHSTSSTTRSRSACRRRCCWPRSPPTCSRRRRCAPVERMRSRAATISTDEISTRLPLPESDDEIRALGVTLNAMLDRLEEGLEHERHVRGQRQP